MATPKLTSDQTNFVYFGIAAVEEIPRILRKLLESQIQPHNLPSAVTNCTTLKLRQEQRCLVCPNSTQDPDYEAFDVTLLYTLLRNLCPAFKPTRGWGINPFNSHLCVGDDIERLRYLRNNSFAHLKSSSISDSDFQKLWSSLEDICKRIEIKMKTLSSSIHYQIGLGDILQKDFGMESLEFYQSFIALDNQNVHRKLSEISKNVDKLVLEQEKKTSKLQICGPSIVEYGADAEFYIKFDGESNNNIHYVSWIRREGAVAHEIDIKNEKYEGSLNEKLMIRNVSFEDNGKYQAIMLELNQTHIHSNQIDLTVSGRIPCVILSGPKSVRFGDTAEICSTIQSDLPILEKKWIINDKNKLMDIDIQTFKYQGSTLHVQTSRLFIHNTNFGDQCIYHFAVSNAIGEVRSDPFVLRVLGSVPRITIGHITDLQARSVRIMTDISIDEHSPPVSSIHWSKDGKPIAENTAKYRFLQENQRSLCILNIDEYDAGLYKCVVANLVGKAESEIVQLGPPEITLKEGTDTEISTTFSARVLSVPSVTTLNWEKIITTDNKPQCIPINIMDSMYQDSCNLCPFPKLVVKKIEAIKLQKIKLIAENFVGKTDVIIDVPEFIKSNQEDNLKRQENMIQFYKEGPSKAKFLIFIDCIRESLSEGDLKQLKYYLHCLELPGCIKVDSGRIEEIDSLLDFFSFLLSKNYFSSTDVVFMQLLLRRIKREDLEKMCIKYATEESKALCYYAESETPVNGFTHVHFHISENIINYPREYAEKIRETIAVLVGCPTDCQECLRLDGIRQTSSFNLVFEMKNEYVQKLLNINPEKFVVLGRYSVDKIIVGGQTIYIDANEMYQQQKMLQELFADDATYYKTRAYKVVFEKIMKTDVVVLVGDPGCGKTSLAHHLALQLKELYHCRPISNITDINHLFRLSKPQLFLLNLLAENMPYPFLCVDESMTRLFKGSKLLITCSNDTFRTSLKCNHRFEKENIIHFNNHAPDVEERLGILRKYCTAPEVVIHFYENETPVFFPLLCKLYSSIQSLHCFGLQFFKEPWLCLHYELDSLIRRDSLSYASLVLCVLHKNKISQEILEKSSTLKVTLQTCNVNSHIKISDIQDSLANMLGSFVSKDGTHFRISHPMLFSIVSSHYGKSFAEAIIKNVSIDFLINGVDLKARVSVHFELEIHRSLFLSLAKRFHEEIQQGRLTILKARIFLSSKFVEFFLQHLKLKAFEEIKKYYIFDHSIKIKIDTKSGRTYSHSKSDSSGVISFLIYYGHIYILKFLTNLLVSHNESTDLMFGGYNDQVKHLVLACYNGDRQLIDFVLKFMKTEVVDMYRKSLSDLSRTELHLIASSLIWSQSIPKAKEFVNTKCQIEASDQFKICDPYEYDMQQIDETFQSSHLSVALKKTDDGNKINKDDEIGESNLVTARKVDHIFVEESLFENNADINQCESLDKSSLLVAASESGKYTVVEKLIDHGTNINNCDKYGESPLFAASKSGHLTAVEKLIECGANIKQCDKYGRSPLFAASKSGHLRVVKKLIDHGADINQCDEYGTCPLFAASRSGHLNVVEKLINSGADIHRCDRLGRNPLFAASEFGRISLVEKLIECGANINQCDEFGKSSLFIASQSGHLNTVEKLIDHGAVIHQHDMAGRTPLHAAAKSGHLCIVEKLIDCGADIYRRDKIGRQPLFAALHFGHTSVVEKLIKCGADVNKCDKFGEPSRIAASKSGHLIIKELTVEHGAHNNPSDKNIESPPNTASKYRNLTGTKKLINHSADIDKTDYGKYSLPASFQSDHTTSVKKQTEYGTWHGESVVHQYSIKNKSKTNKVVNKENDFFTRCSDEKTKFDKPLQFSGSELYDSIDKLYESFDGSDFYEFMNEKTQDGYSSSELYETETHMVKPSYDSKTDLCETNDFLEHSENKKKLARCEIQ